jgi:hypothetical protein
LAVKDNQPMPRQDIRGYFEELETGEIRDLLEDVWTSEEETGHGWKKRREARTVVLPVCAGSLVDREFSYIGILMSCSGKMRPG